MENGVDLIMELELHDIPEYGDHMTLEHFKQNCEDGLFIDYDGVGYYATSTQESDIEVYPSDITSGNINNNFTHIVWYNK
jgi:hypothetical protein